MYNDLYKDKVLRDFMRSNEVSFEQLIRCFNFWSGLTLEEKNNYLKTYIEDN